jgi:hypothetical protein
VVEAPSASHLHPSNFFISSRLFYLFLEAILELTQDRLLDTSLALGNLHGGDLAHHLLSQRADSHMHQDRLFQEARTCLPRIWGAEYPPEQLLDDIENYRPLSLLQACEKLKVDLWNLGITSKSVSVEQSDLDRLWQKIETAGQVCISSPSVVRCLELPQLMPLGQRQVFADVITMARIATHSGGRRVMWTIYHGVLEYHAVRVLFSCLGNQDTFPSWLDTTLTDLLGIAYKSLGENPIMVYRYAWPLTVAMLRTRDPIHKGWISSQVRRAHHLVGNLGIPSHLTPFLEASMSKTARILPTPYREALDATVNDGM